MKALRILSSLLIVMALAACQSSPPPAMPKGVKVGKPYSVFGKRYYPAYDATYDETGIASWYGPGFHGKQTANGEIFNTNDLTAAHPTLPMPSIVRVTNLENGRMLVVRINDRGPFKRGRIIDLSKVSAERLGITGLAKVRVQYLKDASDQYIAGMQRGEYTDMFVYNDQLKAQKEATMLAATAPSDRTFIVEENRQLTGPGDTVSDAAPIISVSNRDLHGSDAPSRDVLTQQAQVRPNRSLLASNKGGEVVLRSPNLATDKPVYQMAANTYAGGSGHYIQIGSFSQHANATKMQRKVSSIASVQIAAAEVGGNQWWRVRAGPFATPEEAASTLASIRGLGIADARIVRQ